MRLKLVLTSLAIAMLQLTQPVFSWGFYGHKKINRMAVMTLPPEMIAFYKQQLEYVSEHAVDPDKRRHSDPEEAPRHYIDLEYYFRHHNSTSIDSIPFDWTKANEEYGEDSIQAWGSLPWTIKLSYYLLVEAFRNKDQGKILHYSADLGHYVADGHVPLHTTVNYNGQLSGQRGIHALWETNIPESEAEKYDYIVGKAYYIHDLDQFIKEMIRESHAQKDSVLLNEKQISSQFARDKKYKIGDTYNGVKKNYSNEFVQAYSASLDGMVERKMRNSILAVASFWYSAWVDAGQPKLKTNR